ncbi:MAG TPA: hypothetical protein VNM24_17085 [Burkholderiales bacterium]|jgi:hypothetical protein|nr:hypothetical protein [Burkholderiales bacterium]
MIRWWAGVVLALSSIAWPHDLITAEAAQRYLTSAVRLRQLVASSAPGEQRAEASYRLGVMLDEIRELLNRDLAAHGEVQGLPSNYLVSELARAGTPLEYSSRKKRYLANIRYFDEALRLAPDGPLAADAKFRLIQGVFYDSFEADPLASGESWETQRAQIDLAESLRGAGLPQEQREELDFILVVRYVRAAGTAPDGLVRSYAQKARTALASFGQRYPGSLRAAAIPVLLDALDTVDR